VTPVEKRYNYKKSQKYLSHVFGHEGPNSLLSYLIQENLATGLSTDSSPRMNEAISEFEMEIQLTDKGESNYESVVEIAFKFLN